MYQNGDLSQIAVTYPINNVEISFSISTSGAIVIFSTMENIDILTLIEELFFILMPPAKKLSKNYLFAK